MSEIKFPEKKKWNEDKAMTIHIGSDNYKVGFNDAIREFKKLNGVNNDQPTE